MRNPTWTNPETGEVIPCGSMRASDELAALYNLAVSRTEGLNWWKAEFKRAQKDKLFDRLFQGAGVAIFAAWIVYQAVSK